MNKKNTFILIFLSLILVGGISLISRVPSISDTKLSAFLSLYIFEIGFTYNAYISMNTTKKAEYLKSKFKWKMVVDYYNFTFYTSTIGLIVTVLFIIFGKPSNNFIIYLYYSYLLFAQYSVFSYWKFTSDFFKRPD